MKNNGITEYFEEVELYEEYDGYFCSVADVITIVIYGRIETRTAFVTADIQWLEQRKEQKEYFTAPLGNDVFQCSPMPWVTYTHISHTNSGKKDNATPLFDWGKYYEKDSKFYIPISVQGHHSFVDGLHIGLFVEKLQVFFDKY